MSKKIKLLLVSFISFIMLGSWAIIYASGSQGEVSNNLWQAGMAASALIFALLGLLTAKQWGGFKSNVGRAVFFLSLGLLFWSLGQAYWTYFLFADPGEEVPQSYVLDLILFSVIPIWIYGVVSLSKATGAKYGLKSLSSKLIAVMVIIFMSVFSYFTLVTIARDGVLFSEDRTAWQSFFDLSFPVGDAVLLTLSLLIFIYSWDYLGGRFKKSILLILAAFALLFLADFGFSYTDGNGTYYNGNVVDLLFMLMVALLGLGLAHLDPRMTLAKIESAYNSSTGDGQNSMLAAIHTTTQPTQPAQGMQTGIATGDDSNSTPPGQNLQDSQQSAQQEQQ